MASTELDEELFDFVLHHIFFPPKLPQRVELNMPKLESQLVRLVQDVLRKFIDALPPGYQSGWHAALNALNSWVQVDIDGETVCKDTLYDCLSTSSPRLSCILHQLLRRLPRRRSAPITDDCNRYGPGGDFHPGLPQREDQSMSTAALSCRRRRAVGTWEGRRIAAHSDFGTMTILFQDEVGGLEVEDIHEKGKFNPAPHIPGTAVVDIGELLMRWSNDELKSTLHRVRAPPLVEAEDSSRVARPRYSIPYFISPDRDSVIDCLPGCHGPDRPKKYEPITSRDYVSMRLNAIY